MPNKKALIVVVGINVITISLLIALAYMFARYNLNKSTSLISDKVVSYSVNGNSSKTIIPTSVPNVTIKPNEENSDKAAANSNTNPAPQPNPNPAPNPTPEPQPLTESTITYNMRVMVVNYNPIENGQNAAEHFYKDAMGNRTAGEAQDYAYNEVINSFAQLSNGRINYNIVKSVDINEFPTFSNGVKYDFATYSKCVWGTPQFDPTYCDQQKFNFDYVKWAKDYNICEQADANNVDEIWVMSLPYVMAWEAFMIGPTQGFEVNGSDYIVDTCQKHYIVLDGAYNSLDNVMHDTGHRVEATMNYVTSVWNGDDYNKYWVQFARWGTGASDTYRHCGNTHFPSNGTSDYDYANYTNVDSTCADWKNFPDLKGTSNQVNCTAWGCNDPRWQTYWLGSLPSGSGEVTMSGNHGQTFQFKRDWWYYLLYPENAISFVQNNS